MLGLCIQGHFFFPNLFCILYNLGEKKKKKQAVETHRVGHVAKICSS